MKLWVRSLALLSGLSIRRCHELWCRLQTQLNPMLLWLWHWLVATAPIGPLTWEPPYVAGVAQEMAKRQKKKREEKYCKYIYICQSRFNQRSRSTGTGRKHVCTRLMDCTESWHFLTLRATEAVYGRLMDWCGKLQSLGQAIS